MWTWTLVCKTDISLPKQQNIFIFPVMPYITPVGLMMTYKVETCLLFKHLQLVVSAVLLRNHYSVMLPAPVNNITSRVEWITVTNIAFANRLIVTSDDIGVTTLAFVFPLWQAVDCISDVGHDTPGLLTVSRALVRGGQRFHGPGSVSALYVVQLVVMQTAKW